MERGVEKMMDTWILGYWDIGILGYSQFATTITIHQKIKDSANILHS
jgi:hypothetical protein